MDANKQKIITERIKRTISALEKNHIKASYAPTKSDAVKQAESGVMDLMKSSRYHYIDRSKGEKELCQAHNADVFFMSSNAITENGELYNVDGNCNRVSALAHGPKKVVILAGYNKIVPDLSAAIERVKEIAAPANGIRLGVQTPCAVVSPAEAR